MSHKHEYLSGMYLAWLGSAIFVLELWINMGIWYEINKFSCCLSEASSVNDF